MVLLFINPRSICTCNTHLNLIAKYAADTLRGVAQGPYKLLFPTFRHSKLVAYRLNSATDMCASSPLPQLSLSHTHHIYTARTNAHTTHNIHTTCTYTYTHINAPHTYHIHTHIHAYTHTHHTHCVFQNVAWNSFRLRPSLSRSPQSLLSLIATHVFGFTHLPYLDTKSV